MVGPVRFASRSGNASERSLDGNSKKPASPRQSGGDRAVACAAVLTMMASGCSGDCSLGCWDGRVTVEMQPPLSQGNASSYHAEVALNEDRTTFTCRPSGGDSGSEVVDQSGDLYIVYCSPWEFRVRSEGGVNTYESVEVRVSAHDGSWEGSTTAEPIYYTDNLTPPQCGPCTAARITVLQDVN